MPDLSIPAQRGACVVGSFMMDLIAYAPRRPIAGETLKGTGFVKAPGGKGFNQAVALARSGVATSMVGRLGDDAFGQQFRDMLRTEGIDQAGVGIDPHEGTGVGLPIVSGDGQNSIIIIPRANDHMTPRLVRDQAGLLQQAQLVLLQLELPMPTVIEAARIAHDAGVRVVLNPAPFTSLPDELLARCDLVVPNETELAAWTGCDTDSDDDVAHMAADLGRTHDIDVLVTLGDRGSLVVPRRQHPLFISAHTVDAIDTVGAGDVFCGYLCGELCRSQTLADAGKIATIASAIAVTRTGGASASPTGKEVAESLGGQEHVRQKSIS